jgi:hypothetical protein
MGAAGGGSVSLTGDRASKPFGDESPVVCLSKEGKRTFRDPEVQ